MGMRPACPSIPGLLLIAFAWLLPSFLFAQDQWVVTADKIDPSNYYGETVANGMIGIVSSPTPFKVKDVVLNGAFDLYGRGRVSNILKTFNFVNMQLSIDGTDIGRFNQVKQLSQSLDMKHASLTTRFNIEDKATIQYTYYSLRQLPYSALVDVVVSAKKDLEIVPASVMEAPDMLNNVQPYYNQIDRPHVSISLLTSTARSPTGKLFIAASNSFMFDEPHGSEPALIHEQWDNNMHLLKFKKK